MARSKKTKAARGRTKASAKKAPKKTAKKAGRRATKKPTRTKTKRGAEETDVERRWREYWECRTALEAAVAAVDAAQTKLAEARQQERERRLVFDRTKNSLRDLLEVEPAGGSHSPSPPAFDGGARLGVVDDDAADEADEA